MQIWKRCRIIAPGCRVIALKKALLQATLLERASSLVVISQSGADAQIWANCQLDHEKAPICLTEPTS